MNVVLSMVLLLPIADPVTQDSDLVRAWLKVSHKHAQDYVIGAEGKPDKPFVLLPQAVFRHSQPVRGDDIGAVYLWVDEHKRPAVIGTTFAFTIESDLRMVIHEFHSLADDSISATRRGKLVWKPKRPGLQFQAIPQASPPASTAKLRQRQVRDIARRFTASSADEQGKRWELRMPAKPVHEFDITN